MGTTNVPQGPETGREVLESTGRPSGSGDLENLLHRAKNVIFRLLATPESGIPERQPAKVDAAPGFGYYYPAAREWKDGAWTDGMTDEEWTAHCNKVREENGYKP